MSVVQDGGVNPEAIDRWLNGPVTEAYDAVEDDTAELMTIEEVRASIERA